MGCLDSLTECFNAQDVTIRAAWIGVIGALFGAVAGGGVTAWATWLTTRAQLRHGQKAREADRLTDILTSLHAAAMQGVAANELPGPEGQTEEVKAANWAGVWRLLWLGEAFAKSSRPGLAGTLRAARQAPQTETNTWLAIMTVIEHFLEDPDGSEKKLVDDPTTFNGLLNDLPGTEAPTDAV